MSDVTRLLEAPNRGDRKAAADLLVFTGRSVSEFGGA
jgi:hypothetical protein